MVSVRTPRLIAAVVVLAALAAPVPAYAQPDKCPQPGLGPPTACVAPDGGGSTTSVAPGAAPDAEPAPALWIGAVLGLSGLAGLAFANARVRDPETEKRR